ncbi:MULTISPECIES: PaaI family thioesterase [unclassified Nocardioides]|uniref:PaaI family thioesterase n=1 Tax=unclassified Nocardioides TaxID=2615069 RepID=UPI0006F38AC5|nr:MULTISPECIES: PaaI family thioesterase [unclassified Nocardioides]KQY56966.1 thioesterase [Nocardioides sp. Root140]KQZ66834.1 thioesterase [Nocardioides sp. Root151]
MFDYRTDDRTPEEIEREIEAAGGLAQSTRELIDAVIRSTVPDDELIAVRKEIDALTARLRTSQLAGPYGIAVTPDAVAHNHGNSVVGLRNAIAPPLTMQRSSEGRAWADFTLGAAYEGPPGLVHGGVSALILDQVCGETAAAGGAPGMTGRLTLSYRRGTPLGDLHAEGRIVKVEGIKTYVEAHISDAEGPTVYAEGLFILPRWARELTDQPKPSTFE